MSFRVLVIPEDPTHNGYILKPLAEMVLAEAGRPAARVTVLTNPRVRGYDQAVRVIRGGLSSRYRFMDLWLFFPDADRASGEVMRSLEQELESEGVTLLCCPARPEVEIYACVAYREELRGSWTEARSNPRFKEAIFEPLLREHGDPRRPGGGRGAMTKKSTTQRRRFFQLCPEIAELRNRIAELLDG